MYRVVYVQGKTENDSEAVVSCVCLTVCGKLDRADLFTDCSTPAVRDLIAVAKTFVRRRGRKGDARS